LSDVFSGLNLNKLGSETWFKTKEYISNLQADLDEATYHEFDIEYREVIWNKFIPHNYEGNLPITFDISAPYNQIRDFTLNGMNISRMDYIYEIANVKVADIWKGTCGDYRDTYTNQEVKSGGLTVDHIDGDVYSTGGEAQATVLKWLQDSNVGWSAGTRQPPTQITDGVGGNGVVDGPPIGTDWNHKKQEPCTISPRIQLKPLVTETKQPINTRYAYVAVDTVTQWWFYSPAGVEQVLTSPTDNVKYRTCSVHATNYYVHMQYEVTVNFIATAKIEFEKYEGWMDDPFFWQADWVWFEGLSGTTDYTLLVDTTNPWETFLADLAGGIFGGFMAFAVPIIIIIAIVFGIYIFIQIGIPLIKGRKVASIAKKTIEKKVRK